MLKLMKNRFFIFGILCVAIFALLFLRLAFLTLVMGEQYYEQSLNRTTLAVQLRGVRGDILDRNGLPLAVNNQVFSVELDRRKLPVGNERINETIKIFLDIMETGEGLPSLTDNLPILINGSEISYIWDDQDAETRQRRFDRWAQRASIDTQLSAGDMLLHLRDRYKISPDIPDVLARSIISIRLDIFMNRFMTTPVRLATNVSHTIVSRIEMSLDSLPGIRVVVEAQRFYPLGESAAHLIGYVGRIDESNVEQLKNEGYNPDVDRVGKTGIEAYAEQWLTASTFEKHGRMLAEIDSMGRINRILEQVMPKDGSDVMLTIDRELQLAVENILRTEIEQMSLPEPPFPYNLEDRAAPLANSGSAVIMDVHNGEILAMASYPSFNLNSFIPWINQEDFDKINEARALTALAFQERLAPGSTFKMLIGIAGLMEGKITLDENIVCRGVFLRHGWSAEHAPNCWQEQGHGPQNILTALKVSCNYFFYEVADRLGIEAINKWADILGVNGITGLNGINEVESSVGSPLGKAESHRANILRAIRMLMSNYIEGLDVTDNTLLDSQIARLSELPYTTTSAEIRNVIRNEMGYLTGAEQRDTLAVLADRIRFDVLRHYKRWLPLDTVLTGTGQSYVRFTPLAAARFAAVIANGGYVVEPKLLRSVVNYDGEISMTEASYRSDANIDNDYLAAIKTGMQMSVFDDSRVGGGTGTAVNSFLGIDPGITLAGKTGTAQTIAGIPEQNTAWFISFAPFDDPQVAIVIMIPRGTASGNAAYVARRVIEEYFRLTANRADFENIEANNDLSIGD